MLQNAGPSSCGWSPKPSPFSRKRFFLPNLLANVFQRNRPESVRCRPVPMRKALLVGASTAVSAPPTLKILNKIRSRADTRFVGSGTQTISMPSTSTGSVVFERRDARKKPEGRHSFTLPKCALSPRETDVCKLLLEGMQLKEVAFRLNISIRTAECHSRNAYAKLGIHCRGEL